MVGVLGFQPASELGPSPSREAELEALCSPQAEQLERLQDHANEPRAKAGTIIRPEEKQALVQLLSDLTEKVKELDGQGAKQAREIGDLRKGLKNVEQDIVEIREHFPALVVETKKRVSALEARIKPKETANNMARINVLAQELQIRAKAGQKGITYAQAAKILKIDKARICQLRMLIAADSRFDITWHPKKKNTKVICLKNYK